MRRWRWTLGSAVWAVAALVSFAWLGSAHAQEGSLSYAPAEPAPSLTDPSAEAQVDDAVIAWHAGQERLALELARDALRTSPESPRARLAEAAVRNDLDPAIALALDASGRRASLDEFEAIGQQRMQAHVVGIVSGVVGLLGVLIAAYLPTLVDMSCFTPSCEENRRQMRFIGGTIGIAGLVGGGVGVGMHVDAGARWGRWADGLRISATPTSLALRF